MLNAAMVGLPGRQEEKMVWVGGYCPCLFSRRTKKRIHSAARVESHAHQVDESPPWKVSLTSETEACFLPSSQVMCDRHFGGINYPVGGVGRIPEELVEGLKAFGGEVWYGANVKQVLLDPSTKRAVSEFGSN